MSETEFNRTFARLLRYYLELRGMTQQEFADKMGISLSTVTFWLSGDRTPRMDKIDKMCVILNCNRSDLLEEKKEYENSELLKRLLLAGGKLPKENLEAFVNAMEMAAESCEIFRKNADK